MDTVDAEAASLWNVQYKSDPCYVPPPPKEGCLVFLQHEATNRCLCVKNKKWTLGEEEKYVKIFCYPNPPDKDGLMGDFHFTPTLDAKLFLKHDTRDQSYMDYDTVWDLKMNAEGLVQVVHSKKRPWKYLIPFENKKLNTFELRVCELADDVDEKQTWWNITMDASDEKLAELAAKAVVEGQKKVAALINSFGDSAQNKQQLVEVVSARLANGQNQLDTEVSERESLAQQDFPAALFENKQEGQSQDKDEEDAWEAGPTDAELQAMSREDLLALLKTQVTELTEFHEFKAEERVRAHQQELLNPSRGNIWQDKAFSGEFADAYISNTSLEGGHPSESFFTHVDMLDELLASNKAWLSTLDAVAFEQLARARESFERTFEYMKKFQIASRGTGDAGSEFINWWLETLKELPLNEAFLIPEGGMVDASFVYIVFSHC